MQNQLYALATLLKVAALGAVVTKSFPPYSIFGCVPANLQKCVSLLNRLMNTSAS